MRVAIWLVVVGCAGGGDPAPPEPSVARPVASGPTTIPAAAPAELPTIRLRSAGAEPRRELRYRPVVGRTHELAIGMEMGVEMTYGGKRMFGQDSPSKGKIALRVAKIAGENITLDVDVREMTEPTFDPDGPNTKSIAGLKGSFTISDRGLVISMSPTVEAGRDSLYLLEYTLPLPVEAVGVGAEWEVDNTVLRGGMTMRAVQVHRLVAFEANGIRASMTETQSAAPQLVPTLSDDPLTIFELRSMSGRGSGETRIAFDKPLPSQVTSEFTFASDMQMTTPGVNQPISMTMNGKTRTTLD